MTRPDDHQPESGCLFEPVPSAVDPVSLQHWTRIKGTLQEREALTLLAVYDYLDAHPELSDVTGMELAAFKGDRLLALSYRPRLTGLHDRSLLEQTPVRKSRADGEMSAHGYRPTVTREAFMRGRR